MYNRELERIKMRNRRSNMAQEKKARFKVKPRYYSSGMYRISEGEQYAEPFLDETETGFAYRFEN